MPVPDAPAPVHLFVYGTLLVEEIFCEVAGCRSASVPAILSGFARYRIAGEVYPGIVPEAEAIVDGRIYYALTPDALQRLDLFEGDRYRRISVAVAVNGKTISAETYVVAPQYENLLEKESWSVEEFIKKQDVFKNQYRGYTVI